jgi:ATP-dependent Clp protease ATP-binding subunit ClpA
MGARPMGRVIHEHIKKPLAPKMLFGELKQGGEAKFSFNTEAGPNESPLVLEIKPKAPAAGGGTVPQRQRAPV